MKKGEVKISQEHYDKLVALAKERGCSIDELVNQAVLEYFALPSDAR